MPTGKTEATELSVAFGLLNRDPRQNLTEDELSSSFLNTLSVNKYQSFMTEFASDAEFYGRFQTTGQSIRTNYEPLSRITSLRWLGPQQQALTVAIPCDIEAANIPVSVKAESNVVLNPSPYNLFVALPSGQQFATVTDNWYVTADYVRAQALYDFVRQQNELDIPAQYGDFEREATEETRDSVQDAIKAFTGNQKAGFNQRYVDFCLSVATYSASTFNNNFRALRTNQLSAVKEIILKNFFRMEGVTYILCGLEHGTHREFGLEIPSLQSWRQDWELLDIEASPDLGRGQSVVDFVVTVRHRSRQQRMDFEFHSEIRWSHGKFCGSPEAKLYKEFRWSEVPFFRSLI